MKYSLFAIAFLFSPCLLAAQPPDFGHFKGLAFSSATDRHPLEIDGGSLVRCEADSSSQLDVSHCEVEKGTAVVTGAEGNDLNVTFTHVTVLRTLGETPGRDYYFLGTAGLMIGSQLVSVAVQVTLAVEDATPNRVRGFIDLPDQSARTSLEAYLVP